MSESRDFMNQVRAVREDGLDDIADMMVRSRQRGAEDQVREFQVMYPGSPSTDDYDYHGAFADGALDIEKLRQYRAEPEEVEEGAELPFEFLPEDYYREEREAPFGSAYLNVRPMQFELTTGVDQFESPVMRPIFTGLEEYAENLTRQGVGSYVEAFKNVNQQDLERGAREYNETNKRLDSVLRELSEYPLGRGVEERRPDVGAGGRGIAELMVSEMTEFLGYYALARGSGMKGFTMRPTQVNQPLFRRFASWAGKNLREAVEPAVLAAEIGYTSDLENQGTVAGAIAVAEWAGLSGGIVDLLKEAEGTVWGETMGNAALGLMIMAGMRTIGNTFVRLPHHMSKGAWNKASTYTKGLLEPMSNELKSLQTALNTSVNVGAFPRIGTTGQYRAGPRGIDSPEAMQGLSDTLTALAEEGATGKHWYEQSSAAILNAVGGDREAAEQLVKVLAITSSSTDVPQNMKHALTAVSQHAAGEPIRTGRFPQAMSEKVARVLDDKEWSGQKTNSFYINLMEEIDPSKVRGISTQDMWMARAFGYPGDTFSGAGEAGAEMGSYAFAERMTQQIADDLGWEPHQVQAAVWTATKNRYELTRREVKAMAAEQGIEPGTPEYAALARKVALDLDDISPESLEKAAYDFSHALADQTGQISFEAIPGRSTGHLPWIHDAAPEIRAEYNYRMMNILLDEQGNDRLAQALGMPNLGTIHGFGGWDGDVNVSGQLLASMPGTTARGIEPPAESQVRAYAAAVGKLFKQEGVAYHKGVKAPSQKAANGIYVNFGRQLNEEETRALYEAVTAATGTTNMAPIPAENGVRFLNFDIDNKEFQAAMKRVLDDFDAVDNYNAEMYTSQGDLLMNDWEANPNGEGYLEDGGGRFASTLERLADELRAKADEVEADFIARFGEDR